MRRSERGGPVSHMQLHDVLRFKMKGLGWIFFKDKSAFSLTLKDVYIYAKSGIFGGCIFLKKGINTRTGFKRLADKQNNVQMWLVYYTDKDYFKEAVKYKLTNVTQHKMLSVVGKTPDELKT